MKSASNLLSDGGSYAVKAEISSRRSAHRRSLLSKIISHGPARSAIRRLTDCRRVNTDSSIGGQVTLTTKSKDLLSVSVKNRVNLWHNKFRPYNWIDALFLANIMFIGVGGIYYGQA